VTRRPKSRLPPKLPDPVREHAPSAPHPPSLREQVKSSRIAGRSATFSQGEVLAMMTRLARNDTRTLLGCAPFAGITIEHVRAAVAEGYGWTGDGPRARISPDRTVDAFDAACARVLEIARQGGRIAFATSSPASLFAVHRELARIARASGADVFEAGESASFRGRDASPVRLRWVDLVAMATDGRALLGDDESGRAANELLFAIGHPDLLVADRTFAGTALAAGIEVVAFVGLDALALTVAAWRGLAIRVVPVDEQQPPGAYRPLLGALSDDVDDRHRAGDLAAEVVDRGRDLAEDRAGATTRL
jgi:hypothetical protein